MDCRVLGMDLDEDGMEDLTQPLSAFVIVKGIAADGDVTYWSTSTPDLTDVECLGMVGYADLTLRAALTNRDEDI